MTIPVLFDGFINSEFAGDVGQTKVSNHVLHLKPVDPLIVHNELHLWLP